MHNAAVGRLSSPADAFFMMWGIENPTIVKTKVDFTDETVCLFLDAAEFTDSEALARTEDSYSLLLGETFVIEPKT